jgi:hypothetical protein
MKNKNQLTKIALCTFVLYMGLFVFSHNFLKPVHAATGINKQINFQGKLVDANGLNVANATYTVVFSMYSVASGGTAIWTETQNVTTANGDGIFQVQLGSITSLPGSVDFNTDNIYLGIKVNSDAEMTPRVRFTAVPYAFNAEKVGGMTVTNTTGTFTLAAAKTLTVSNTLTLAGTDGKTLTLNGNTTLADNVITFGGTQQLTLAATKSVVFADAFNTVGAFATTLTSTGVTNVTLPTTGTLLTNTASANQTVTSTQSSGTVLGITDSTALTGAVTGIDITLSGGNAQDQTGLKFNLSGATGTNLNDIVGTAASWKVSKTGALTVASCSGCGGGTAPWSALTAPTGNLTLAHSTHATVFNSAATTQNFFTMNGDSLSTGKLLTLSSTSGAITSGELLYANHTATYGTATITGSVVDVNRSITGTALNTVTVSGPLAKFTDLCAHGLGVCTSSNNVVEIAQNFTANTGSALSITHAGTGLGLNVSGSATGTLNAARLQNTIAAAANSGAQLLFAANRTTSGTTNVAGVSGIITDITDGAYKGALVFSTANNAIPAERMRIDNAGKVGIGITDPNSKLHVAGSAIQDGTSASAVSYATRENVLIFNRGDLPTSWLNKISSSISSTTTDNTINFELATGASTNINVMTLNAAGSVGIGISNPTAQLEVASSATTTTAQLITGNSLTSGKGLSVASSATGFTGSLIEASLTGNNAANTGALLKSSITGASSVAVGAMITNLGTGLSLRINDETGDADTTPVVVDAAGYLGLGLTAPTRQTHIYGAGQAASAITDAGNKGGTLYLQDSLGGVDNGGAMIFGASQGFFAGIKSLIQSGLSNTIGDLAFLTRNLTSDTALTERIRILSTGQVGIGITNPTASLDLASAATTTNAQTITANSLTSGKGLSVNSTATAFTGILTDISLTGNNAANTGTLLRVTNGANASNANTLVLFTNGGTGTSFRVNDDGTDTDTTPFIIDAAGNVGIGVTNPATPLSVGSTSQFQVAGTGAVTAVGVNSGTGLLQGTGGLTLTGISNINSTLTAATNIGNSTGILTLVSGGASSWTNTSGLLSFATVASGIIKFQPLGAGATGDVQIGEGGSGSTTPDLLKLDAKSDAGDPTGTNGAMYYNVNTSKFRCFEAAAWKNCDTTSAGVAWSAISAPAGDLTLSHGTNITTFNSAATTQNFFTMNGDSLTTGNLLNLKSSLGTITSGNILNADHTAAYPTATVTGSTLNVNRSLSGSLFGALTVTGPAAKFTDMCAHNAGSCTSSASVVEIAQNFTGNTGNALSITQLGTGLGLSVSGAAAGTLNSSRLVNTVAAAANSGAQLLFTANRTTSGLTNVAGVSGIITDITDGAYKGALVFSTANNAAPAERMRIDNAGKVGIGITDPNSKLHVAGSAIQDGTSASAVSYATRENVLIFNRGDLPTSWLNKISSSISSTTTDNTINFELATGASTNINVMTLNAAGSVGIGISNPTAQLEVASSATTTTAQLITGNSLTSGKGLSVASSATGFTGSLIEASLTGNNAANTGALLKSSITGASSVAVGAMITNLGTGLSLRINDETGDADTTPVVVDAAGYLGLGLTAPTRQTHIYGAGQAASAITDAGNKGGTLYLQDSLGGVDNGGAMIFGASQGFFAGIKSLIQSGLSNTIGDLAFLTRNLTSDTALTERIRILSTGQVGIGITNPTASLDLASAATTTNAQTITANSLTSGKGLSVNSTATAFTGILTDISLTGNNAANTGTLLRVTNGANASNANTLVLFTNGGTGTSFRVNDDGTDTDTTPFIIDNAGKVGINIAAPTRTLSFPEVLGEKISLYAVSASAQDYFGFGIANSELQYQAPASSHHSFYSGTSEKVRIDGSGNLGIGITGPSTSLHVQGAGLAENTLIAQAIISSTAAYNANPVAGINFYNKYSSGGAYAGMGGIGVGKLNTTDGDYSSFLGLYTRTHGGSVTERIRIDNAGSVGIGNTNPGTVLDVTGFITSRSLNTANGAVYTDSTGKLLTTATGGAGNLCLVSASGAAPSFTSCPAGSALWSAISAPTGDLTLAHSTHATVFNSAATTQNFFTMNADSLSTGKLLTLGSTSGSLTSGEILNANHIATYGTVTVTGSVLNVNRSISGFVLNTVTVSGSVAKFTDNCNHNLGVCSSSANVVDITQSFASNTGTALNISHLGTGLGLSVSGTATGTLNAVRIQNTVAAANNSGSQILFNANRTTSGATNIAGVAGIITDITDGAYKGALVFSTANNAAPAERMRIDNSGNVGIGITSSLAGNLDVRQLANGNDVFYSRRNTDSSPTGNFIRLSNNAGTTDLFKVEINGDVKLGNTTSTIGLTATDNTAVFNIVDSAGTPNKLLQLKDLNTNFGSLLLVGAVEGRNSYFEEDYNSFRGTAATADCIQGRGSYGNPGTAACTAGTGQLTLDVTLGTSATANVSSLADTVNGIERITATSSTLGTAVAMEYLGSAAINNAQMNWAAANLPVYSAKMRTTVTPSSSERYYFGLSDMQTPAVGTPSNGIFFTNCSTAGGSPSCDGTMRGMVVSGGSIVGTVQACAAPGTSAFGYYRFEVRSTGSGTGEVHFYYDTDVSNGIVESECGSGISGVTLPSAAMTTMLKVDATSVLGGAATLDVDYFRVWQDDAAVTENTTDIAATETTEEEPTADSEQTNDSQDELLGKVDLLSHRMLDLESKTASIEAALALYSSAPSTSASPGAELDLESINAKDGTFSGDLNVLGRTLLTDVGITGKLTAGLLTITGLDEEGNASINTTAGPLRLQSDGFNGVDILNGKIVIDTKGNMKVNGTVTVKKLNVDTEDVAGASLGTVIIPIGRTSIEVDTSALTNKSKIFVTAERPVAIGAKAKDDDTFTITLDNPQLTEVKISWWVIN